MGIKLVPIHRALAKDEWNNIYKILCTGLRESTMTAAKASSSGCPGAVGGMDNVSIQLFHCPNMKAFIYRVLPVYSGSGN